MKQNTGLTIKDISNRIEDFCPIKIYINDKLAWDDNAYTPEDSKQSLAKYLEILNREDFVLSITFDIVMFHHSIVYIETE